MPTSAIASLLDESRLFDPPAAFQAKARVGSLEEYRALWQASMDDPDAFWRQQAAAHLTWIQPPSTALSGAAPDFRWFEDGTLNASVNCLDRHAASWRANKAALIWEGEPGDIRTLTYRQLLAEVARFAAGLRDLGMQSGDRATIYMPMVPEAVVAMLACARLGITHNVVFAGFSGQALAERNNDCEARLVITADGAWRRGEIVPLKASVDEALQSSPTVERVIVLRRVGRPIEMQAGRDIWWHTVVDSTQEEAAPVELASEHPLFLLYTSGSTGKPKGILHTTAGYLLQTKLSFELVFDHHDEDVYWCTADVGWITGHSYVVYGPLAAGATVFLYEGAPTYPDPSRFWQMVARHRVSVFYTAPTAIRTFHRAGDRWVKPHDLSSLRLLGTVGEPINPDAWTWYREVIGGGRCPIVDTWWQTETGSIMISPLPGATPTVPGSATLPLPGIRPEVVDGDGQPVEPNAGGLLVLRQPWPSMLRGVWGDPDRYRETYWSRVPGNYFTGDGARCDERGYTWILGRIDDVLNIAGHRLSTMEVESALVSHTSVSEAAVVGRPDDVRGEAIVCFVTLSGEAQASEALKQQLAEHVCDAIGKIARPDEIRFAPTLPKTRSGKIMRRLLRDIAAGRASEGDMTTLEDHSTLEQLRGSQADA